MAKQSPSLYSVHKTFIWFAVVSILLTASLAGIVYTDYQREWKVYQKKFTQLKAQKTKAELAEAERAIDRSELESLTKKHLEATDALRAEAANIDALTAQLDTLNTRVAQAKATYQDEKQFLDSYRYYFEEYRRHHDHRAAEYEKKLSDLTPKVDASKARLEAAEAERDAKQAEIDAKRSASVATQKQLDKLLEEKNRLSRRLAALSPSIAKDILNAPMLDFVAPTLEVQQIVLDDLYDDYHFAKTQKVDRCTTCHLGIDQKGFEDAPQPFRTHPNLDLYLGASSAHPVEKFGCTVCHGGSGHSVSFKDSAHTPNDETQAARWKKEHGWQELEKWDAKMLPLKYTQAACAKCHRDATWVPQADKLNEGRKLAEQNGCMNCHKIQGFEDRWKVGPELEHIDSKLTPEWVAKWLADPRSFRDNTNMPRIFHLSNTDSPEDRDRNNAAIASIVAYLYKNVDDRTIELKAPPQPGDVQRGEELVKTIGCTGCHTVAGVSSNSFGPDLDGLGSKVSSEWLYTWLKDPKHYSEETRMPDLRLNDQEAADITAYLLTLKNDAFDAQAAPQAKPEVIDQLVLTHLQGSMRSEEASAALSKMSAEERLEFLGKKSIAHQGCYTCHTINGFGDAKPIGADLSNEGRKDLHQFDFGFVHDLPHTRHDWITQKIKEPRIFDQGKEKAYYDKLRMPQFNFNDQEVEALTTFVLSLTQEEMPLKMQKRLDLKELEIEKGRLLVSKLNCAGCHTVDGIEGALRRDAEVLGSAPPTLQGEGAKVQEKWLHDFLAHPTPIRPWLTYRMPTFGFTDEELQILVHYFANLSDQTISYRGQIIPPTTPEKLAAGHELFGKLQCVKCHQVNAASAAMGASFLAPELQLSKVRLKPEWVSQWITDPQSLEEGTMMPGFFPDGATPLPDVLEGDAAKQIEAIRDYLYTYETSDAAPAAGTTSS